MKWVIAPLCNVCIGMLLSCDIMFYVTFCDASDEIGHKYVICLVERLDFICMPVCKCCVALTPLFFRGIMDFFIWLNVCSIVHVCVQPLF